MAQQKKQIDEAIEAAQNTQLEKNAEEQNISLKEFDGILQPIIDSCTKDSISQGKYKMHITAINIKSLALLFRSWKTKKNINKF